MKPAIAGSVRTIALAVTDDERADRFYGETLGLPPAIEDGVSFGFLLDKTLLQLKPVADWYGRSSGELNARITLEVGHAAETEKALRAAGDTISDPIAVYGATRWARSWTAKETRSGFARNSDRQT